MQIKLNLPLFLLVAAAALSVQAQTSPTPGPKPRRAPALELTYDYIHSNGPPHNCDCFAFQGGGIAYTRPIGSTHFDFIGKLGVGHTSGIGANVLSGTLVTYTAGARYYPRLRSTRLQPYGEMQLGAAHAGGNLFDAPNPAGSNAHSAFAGSVGGGLNLALTKRFALKLADVQYLATTFANGDNNHQNNLRVSAGLVLRFGK